MHYIVCRGVSNILATLYIHREVENLRNTFRCDAAQYNTTSTHYDLIDKLMLNFYCTFQFRGEHRDRRGHQEILLQSWNQKYTGKIHSTRLYLHLHCTCCTSTTALPPPLLHLRTCWQQRYKTETAGVCSWDSLRCFIHDPNRDPSRYSFT